MFRSLGGEALEAGQQDGMQSIAARRGNGMKGKKREHEKSPSVVGEAASHLGDRAPGRADSLSLSSLNGKGDRVVLPNIYP
jgi:hypothetical protein